MIIEKEKFLNLLSLMKEVKKSIVDEVGSESLVNENYKFVIPLTLKENFVHYYKVDKDNEITTILKQRIEWKENLPINTIYFMEKQKPNEFRVEFI